jgi:hypothetical protein
VSALLSRWTLLLAGLMVLRLPLALLSTSEPWFFAYALIYAIGASLVDAALVIGIVTCAREFDGWTRRCAMAVGIAGLVLGALFSLAGGLLVALYPGVILYEAIFASMAIGLGFALGLVLGTTIDAVMSRRLAVH